MIRHFCDWNAGNPLDPRVLEAMRPFLEANHGNPSSLHSEGRLARRAVEEARSSVAEFAGVDARDVVFTSGATESNHLAVTTFRDGPWLVSAIEHPCMLAAVDRRGQAERIPVAASGVIDLGFVNRRLVAQLGGVAVMGANNETGVIQPVREVAHICAVHGVPLHVDASQVPLRARFDWPEGATTASFSAHKMRGPKGVGALVIRPGSKVIPMLAGGSQERERRAGTENVAGIVGFGVAARFARQESVERVALLAQLDAMFLKALKDQGVSFELHGHGPERLPGALAIRFMGVSGEGMVMGLDLEGVAIGLGSACSSGAARPSPVLAAMGVGKQENLETVRFSFGPTQSEADMLAVASKVSLVVKRVSCRV